MSQITNEVKNQIKKRRTFAIISHPDAGKTTLTEKFLLWKKSALPFSPVWSLEKVKPKVPVHL